MPSKPKPTTVPAIKQEMLTPKFSKVSSLPPPIKPTIVLKNSCREWQKSLSKGYGQYWRLDEQYAHRVSHTVFNRNGVPIPEGVFVCHHCDNRKCIEPEHLFEGSAKDNSQDMVAKGRATKCDTPAARYAQLKQRGVAKSDAHRAAISAAKQGKKMSPEACANIAAAQLGRKDSDETRAIKSEAAKKRWAEKKAAE